MKSVLLVACIHGDERFGLKIAQSIKHGPLNNHVNVVIANPLAVKKRQRFIETDMNRSFAADTDSYESKIAKQLLSTAKNYKYVLDIHNTNTAVLNVPIIATYGPRTKTLLKLHPSSKVIVMSKDIARHSLIGNLGDGAVSFEYNRIYADETGLQEMLSVIAGLVGTRRCPPNSKDFYYVNATIPLDCSMRDDADYNFKYMRDLDGYGILTGKNTYTTHQGFLAHKKEVLKL